MPGQPRANTIGRQFVPRMFCTGARSQFFVIATEYCEYRSATRCCHMSTNAAEVSLSTDFQTCLIAGSVFPQIARLHQRSPFSLPSSVAHIDLQAMRLG